MVNYIILRAIMRNVITHTELENLAGQIRYVVTDMICRAGSGHIGGSLGIVDILVSLYFAAMKDEPHTSAERDRFILSKGHCGPALYATLAFKGVIPFDWLKTLNKPGTKLPSHVDRLKTPGIDMTAGSLGQGLSAACGMALALRMNQKTSKVYCLLGDGENQEGQIWEAAMYAAHNRLDNLIAITDVNGLQIDGCTDEVLSLGELRSKWSSFGWEVLDADGHSFPDLSEAFERAKLVTNRPVMILARTVKAKGHTCFEGMVESHNIKVPDAEMHKKYLDGVDTPSRDLPYRD